MKTHSFLTTAVVLVLSVLFITSARAQSSTNSPPNFLQTAEGYVTSNNTNFSWIGNKLEIAVGADFENSQQWANNIDGQYNLSDSWGIGGRMRNAGIAGTVESQEAKLSFAPINTYALKIETSLYAGYDNQYSCAVIEPQVGVRKKLTPNTFAGVYISEPFLINKNLANALKQWSPNIGAETGCTLGNISSTGQSVALRTRASHTMTAVRHFLDPHSL